MRQTFLGFSALLLACSADPTGPSAVALVTIDQVVTLNVGARIRPRVLLYDAAGRLLENRTVTFASSNADVMTVDDTGLVRAVGEGQATLTATSEGKRGRSIVLVVPVTECGGCWDYGQGVMPP